MKQLIILVCFVCYTSIQLLAQEIGRDQDSWYTLTLEIKNPTGWISQLSYFLLTVYNKTDEEVYVFPGCNGNEPPVSHSTLISQLMTCDGEIVTRELDACFFYDQRKTKTLRIGSHSSIKQGIPLKMHLYGMNYIGLLPPKNMNGYQKVRAGIKKFITGQVKGHEVHVVTLYSNWVDISTENFSGIAE